MPSNTEYHDFIREAFIQPIRSVLIVDDDYPTYSEILSRQSAKIGGQDEKASRKLWLTNPERINKVIDSFRKEDRPLLVDVHDGGDGDERKMVYHLHQSDLLVLDYQLDGPTGDGTKAIEIARSIMSNDHFNLVAVHTSAPLEQAFREILLGLMSRRERQLAPGRVDRALALVGEAELDINGILEHLKAAFKEEQYFALRKTPQTVFEDFLAGKQPFSDLRALCAKAGWTGDTLHLMFEWAVHDFEVRAEGRMDKGPERTPLQWSDDVKWIRSRSGFIAFTNKTKGDVDILHDLWQALIAWSPKPSRLFLTKLRSELEGFGVAAEDAALGNDFVLARWYSDLLKGSEWERRTLIDASIARHSEQLLDYVQRNVLDFAARLVDEDSKGELKDNALVKFHFKVDLDDRTESDRAERDHNIFVCSKPAKGWHLQTGHVFEGAGAHWICLSPSCDLVPGQKHFGYFKDLRGQMPFLAVRLKLLAPDQVPIGVQSNRYVFLDLEKGQKKVFCINEPQYPNSSPHWYPLHAAEFGRLDGEMKFKFVKLETKDGKLVAGEHEARVVGQLRYEYAINLSQMLGATFTRIGLDFLGADRVAPAPSVNGDPSSGDAGSVSALPS